MRKDLTGKTYSGLTVIGYDCFKSSKNHWWCKCVCGKIISVAINNLNRGQQSCGCLHKEWVGNMSRKHGLSRTGIYRIWAGIKRRCFNQNVPEYKYYGGRGITMCDEWATNFISFKEYMGERPSKKHTIDRINNDGNYEPGNVRWATPKEQENNKRRSLRVSFNGTTMSVLEISEKTGFKYETLKTKLKRGEDISNLKFIKERKRRVVDMAVIKKMHSTGKTPTQIAEMIKVPPGSVSYRIKRYLEQQKKPYW